MIKKKTSGTYQRAHDLRHEPTETESRLWAYLRSHRIRNIHFRRQHSIGNYIVDFCAPRQKLIIELDGSQHLEHARQDKDREAFLRAKGYRILRFWNHEVTNHLEDVIIAIEQTLFDQDIPG